MALWGVAFPVLETMARSEGLEIIREKLIGPNGYFPDNHIQGLLKKPDPLENEARKLRKRSTDNLIDVEELDQKVRFFSLSYKEHVNCR